MERPFRILGLQQIALGHLERERLTELWIDRLGLSVRGTYRSPRDNVDEWILSLGGPDRESTVEVDLMTPLDPELRPKVHEPALNHIGLWVDDLRAAVTWLTQQGVRIAPGGIRPGASGHDICFIHPKPSSEFPVSGAGVLIELVQAPPEVIANAQRTPREGS